MCTLVPELKNKLIVFICYNFVNVICYNFVNVTTYILSFPWAQCDNPYATQWRIYQHHSQMDSFFFFFHSSNCLSQIFKFSLGPFLSGFALLETPHCPIPNLDRLPSGLLYSSSTVTFFHGSAACSAVAGIYHLVCS